jgi:acetyl esterase/lipase
MRKHITWLMSVVLLSACANAASGVTPTDEIAASPVTPAEPPEPRWPDVPYVPEGDLRQKLDVYLPETGEGPFPTILAMHGGGFQARSKTLYRDLAGQFNGLGYALVSTNYRLAPSYSYPAQVEDVFCALAWVHANHATYDLVSQRVFVMGDAAGGYLASMLGTVDKPNAYLESCPHTLPESNAMRGVVVFYGFYDFMSIDGYAEEQLFSFKLYWGAPHSDIPPETLAEMSPMSWIDGSEPPFLLMHGTEDTSIPSGKSEDFATALEQAGVEVELLLIETEYAFILQSLSSPTMVQALEATDAFLSARSGR